MKFRILFVVLLTTITLFSLCSCGNGNTITDGDTVSTFTTTITESTTTTTATTTTTEATTTTTNKATVTLTSTITTATSTTTKKPTTTTTTAKPTTTTKKATTTTVKKTTTKKMTTTTKKDTIATTSLKEAWDNYVQEADPETGISWDGKSPIIYTYEDGTTGTEPKENAQYECAPGIYRIVAPYPRDGAGRLAGTICEDCGKEIDNDGKAGFCYQTIERYPYCGSCGEHLQAYTCHHCLKNEETFDYCERCGKKNGDGRFGTCAINAMGDTCGYCGKSGVNNKCHTCTGNCAHCGKPMGNGKEGTCYRGIHVPSNCPGCGATVDSSSCHSCKK